MSDDRWERVADLYQAAQERAPEERLAFVRQASDNDSGLRREIESLLAQDEKTVVLDRPIAAAAGSLLADNAGVQPGNLIGPYRIDSLLGVGGMGEVYRARDTKLNRDVAVKILPPALATDPDRLARFKREAQVLASLNHPNIASIHGFEDSSGVHALVLELVEGPTLADRIARGPLPIDEALKIAKQIAEALEAAHEQGIIHRDLKPANIKVRDDDTVKVLDFGLAKALEPTGVASSSVTMSPTITSPAMTQAGIILGTAAYMSPEQAKGRPVDKRSDVWAFGCVLYEMLAGQRAFGGEEVSETLAHVLLKEPDWAALPADTPAPIRKLLARSLKKDRKLRLDSAAAARLEIDEALSGASDPTPPSVSSVVAASPSQWGRAAMAAAASLLSAALASYAAWQLKPAPSLSVVRLAVPLAGQRFATTGRRGLAVSPNGEQFVYVADRHLQLRKFSQSESTAIRGTDDPIATPNNPVFSPDGQSLAFYAGGAIKRIAVTGGTATVLCAAPSVVGMSWGSSGIIFSEGGRIKKVAAAGGEPQLLFQLTQGIATDVDLLPGGQTLLLAIAADSSGSRSRIVVQPLPSGEPKVIVEDGSDPRYWSSGQLIFARGGVLFAAGFDIQRLALSAEPVAVLEGVRRGSSNTGIGAGQFAISDTGTLAFIPGPASFAVAQRGLMLVDIDGTRTPLNVPPLAYQSPRASMDGRWVAVDVADGNEANVYIYRLSGEAQPQRLTLKAHNRFPIWSPDNLHVTFQSDVDGQASIVQQRADGTGELERLTTAEQGTSHVPEAWSPDGTVLLFAMVRDGIYTLQSYSTIDRRVRPFNAIRSIYPPSSTFSPDGHWVAYYERDPGSATGSLFVRPFNGGREREVQKGGGIHPMWLAKQNELQLLYQLPGSTNVVHITTSPEFEVGTPTQLPWLVFNPGPAYTRNVDPIAGTGRFVTVSLRPANRNDSQSGDEQIQIVLNWTEELKHRPSAH